MELEALSSVVRVRRMTYGTIHSACFRLNSTYWCRNDSHTRAEPWSEIRRMRARNFPTHGFISQLFLSLPTTEQSVRRMLIIHMFCSFRFFSCWKVTASTAKASYQPDFTFDRSLGTVLPNDDAIVVSQKISELVTSSLQHALLPLYQRES